MKSAIVGEYIIQVEQSGHVTVYRIYDNVKESLREIYNVRGLEYNDKAKTVGMEVNPVWNTQTLGSKIIDFVSI